MNRRHPKWSLMTGKRLPADLPTSPGELSESLSLSYGRKAGGESTAAVTWQSYTRRSATPSPALPLRVLVASHALLADVHQWACVNPGEPRLRMMQSTHSRLRQRCFRGGEVGRL